MAESVLDSIFQYSVEIDRLTLLWIQNHLRFAWLTPIMRFVSFLGNYGAIWIVLGLLLIVMKRYRKNGIIVLLAITIGAVITNLLLKNLVARPRPFDVSFVTQSVANAKIFIQNPFGVIPIPGLTGQFPIDYSFPSGHTTASVAAGMAVSMNRRLLRRIRIPAVILAVLIPISRLYMGVHYPADVLAGVIVGIFAALLAENIVRFFTRKGSKKEKQVNHSRQEKPAGKENTDGTGDPELRR